jgi:glucokinase
MTRLLGIDVGATKIAAAIVDSSTGDTEPAQIVPTHPERGGADVLTRCVQLAESILGSAPPAAIGIGICELVDPQGQITTQAVENWDERVAIEWDSSDVMKAFAHLAPVRIESDVRAGALAEARFGSGSRYGSFFYVNVGSGISSTFVLDGTPVAGARGNAIILGGGPLHIERSASGVALAARYGATSATQVSEAALAGDTRARDLIAEAGRAVGGAIAFAVNLLDPEAVVVGGSVALDADGYWGHMEAALREHVWATDTQQLALLPAALGSRAGVIGAALAALPLLAAPR